MQRYSAPSTVESTPCVYVIQPNMGGNFKGHYKIGRSKTINNRFGEYSTCYPKELGGFTVFGVLNTSKAENVAAEKRAHTLAINHNFHRIDEKSEFFKYTGTNVWADTRKLLLEVRGGRFGNLTVYNRDGEKTTIAGGHLNLDAIKPAPAMTTRASRIHDTVDGGRRVLRPTK